MGRVAVRISWRLVMFLAVLVTSSGAAAQRLEHVGDFSVVIGGGGIEGDNVGDLQFVPGGYVITTEGARTKRYIFRGNRFERFKGKLPSALENWSSDWDADFFDEIDLRGSNSKVKRYLPKGAKLKRVLEIPADDGSKASLLLACYTLRSYETRIFIAGLLNTGADGLHEGRAYRKLWTIKPNEGWSYGDLQYQLVSGVGGFVLLYSGAPGGDSMQLSLDVYRIHWDKEPGSLSKSETALRK